MNKRNIVSSVAFCGLVCTLCHLADECDGCKSDKNRCGKNVSEAGCFHYRCCIEKHIQGCWECSEFPCEMDMYSESKSPKIKAFARCIREEGIDQFAHSILHILEQGLDVSLEGDLDNKSEQEVLALLRKSAKSPFL